MTRWRALISDVRDASLARSPIRPTGIRRMRLGSGTPSTKSDSPRISRSRRMASRPPATRWRAHGKHREPRSMRSHGGSASRSSSRRSGTPASAWPPIVHGTTRRWRRSTFACSSDLYRGFCDAFAQTPSVSGFYVWNWFGFGGPRDAGFTPRGKPAAHELAKCFARPLASSRTFRKFIMSTTHDEHSAHEGRRRFVLGTLGLGGGTLLTAVAGAARPRPHPTLSPTRPNGPPQTKPPRSPTTRTRPTSSSTATTR